MTQILVTTWRLYNYVFIIVLTVEIDCLCIALFQPLVRYQWFRWLSSHSHSCHKLIENVSVSSLFSQSRQAHCKPRISFLMTDITFFICLLPHFNQGVDINGFTTLPHIGKLWAKLFSYYPFSTHVEISMVLANAAHQSNTCQMYILNQGFQACFHPCQMSFAKYTIPFLL